MTPTGVGAGHGVALLVAGVLAITVACARAGEPVSTPQWPSRTVRLITPLAAGGGPDLVARTVAEALAVRWRQAVIVDNRPGADGILAVRAVIDAADEHTLLFSPNSVVTANPIVRESLPYAIADVVPIAAIVDVPIAIVTGSSVAAKTLPDLLASAKRSPGTYAYTSVFGAPHLVWTALLKHAAIDMSLVGYRNPNVAIPDLIERRVHAALLPLGTILTAARAGNVRLLAILSSRRSAVVPDVPTIAEAGYGEFTADGALGLFSAGPQTSARREWIAAEVKAVTADEAVARKLLQAGFEVWFQGPREYSAALSEQRTRLGALTPVNR